MQNALAIPGVEFTRTGLKFDGEVSFDAWLEAGTALATVEQGIHWMIGDWLLYGDGRKAEWGAMYAEAMERFSFAYQTLRNDKRLAESFKLSRRRDKLSFGHHDVVAALPPAEQDQWLNRAEREDWSVAKLKAAMKQPTSFEPEFEGCRLTDLDDLVSRGKQFGCIYADPPWQYDNKATRSAADSQYKGTMSVDEICALPVADLAAEEAHLHLWTTNGFLFDAARVIEAWGFTYKSVFVWVKPSMGIGNYWRVSHEFLLLGIRGGLGFRDNAQMSWAEHKRGNHSAKPEAIRRQVEMVSQGPFLEMFGRRPTDGWTVWGNQVRRDLLVPVVGGG